MVYKVLGLMSGSSMDGLDMAFCTLEETAGKWKASIEATACVPFTEDWKQKLQSITTIPAKEFFAIHTAFGAWMGQQINEFINQMNLAHQVHIIASHGHTAFHLPQLQTTVQIGCGAAIAAATGIATVSDLRAMDVALGGNGAPIVPIAEKLLFADTSIFLNIGGICNISFAQENKYIAYDVCPANRVLNELALQTGKPFDEGGNLAKIGVILPELLNALNQLDYYRKPFPKSLANEMGTHQILPMIENAKATIADKLATMVEHIALQIAAAVEPQTFCHGKKMMVTGGGAWNTFLIEKLQQKLQIFNIEVFVPEESIVNYKEALAMALIGALRWREEENVLASVTGASKNSIGGALWMGQE